MKVSWRNHDEIDRYYRDKFEEETKGLSLRKKLERAISSKVHTYWWYGQRWARLRELVRGTDIEEAACSIMANGVADPLESPTASQQFHSLEHELARTRLALRNCLALSALNKFEGDWSQVERFCADVGVNQSLLRTTMKSSGSLEFKRLRKELKLTQTQAAKKIGVAFATVNRWERGIYLVPKDAIDKLIAPVTTES